MEVSRVCDLLVVLRLGFADVLAVVLGFGLAGAVLTTLLAQGQTYIDAVRWGLHVATVAAVLGGLASLARTKRKEATEK